MNEIGDSSELRREAAALPMHGLWTRGRPAFSQLADRTVLVLGDEPWRRLGDSGAVGMWAFATGAWLSGLFQANLLPLAQLPLL